MRLRAAALLLVVLAAGLAVWRAELFTVARPGEAPRALERLAEVKVQAPFDVALPVVPVGVERVTAAGAVRVVHYWAPWERHSRAQAESLDSLLALLPAGAVRVHLVCFDPFPSVARYVARVRLRTPVLLDLQRELQRALPCPSIPYTWVLDAEGRVLVRQSGEVDWLAPASRALLLEAAAARDSLGGAGTPLKRTPRQRSATGA